MFLTVITIWLVLSAFATLLVLAAVIRSGQLEQMDRDKSGAEEKVRRRGIGALHSSEAQPTIEFPHQRRSVLEPPLISPIQTTHFTSDSSDD